MSNEQPNRWWCFTINNPTECDDEQLNTLSSNVDYLVYAQEICPSTSTPHYQGYVELSKPQRFSWIKRRLPRAYLAPRKGSRTQARDYCFKECDNPVEFGRFKEDRQGQRNDILAIKRKIDEGYCELDLYEEHMGSMLRYGRGFRRYMLLKRAKIEPGPCKVLWIYGPTGSGKTRWAKESYPDYYEKSNNKWWDGYDGQKVVIWDDYEKTDDYTYTDLLKWTDRYRKKGEAKGETVNLVYTTLIFTSVNQPSFDEQFLRRCDVVNITHVTSLQTQTQEQKQVL